MTSDIRAQVENVVALIGEMITLVEKTQSHSGVSAEDLKSLVNTAATMSQLDVYKRQCQTSDLLSHLLTDGQAGCIICCTVNLITGRQFLCGLCLSFCG